MGLITFSKAKAPVTRPVTKFGGQPCWIGEPQWPLSRATGDPMQFICQIRLPVDPRFGEQRMAFVFMSGDDTWDLTPEAPATWEALAGENAVILQPAAFDPVVATTPLEVGPTLFRGQQPVELNVHESVEDPPFDPDRLDSRIGGEPAWLQSDETPTDGSWIFLAQIDSTTDEFEINFGDAGVAYVFVEEGGRQARFLWQCL